MSRQSNSSFYVWLKKEIQIKYDLKSWWVGIGEKDRLHPEYRYRPDYVFELLNPTTILINGSDVIKTTEPVYRIEINPFSSGKNAAQDLYFESEARAKLNRWFESLKRDGLDVFNPPCSEQNEIES